MIRGRFSTTLCVVVSTLAIAGARRIVLAVEVGSDTSVSASAPHEEGVLVLRDGGVLRGRVTREGDRYVVIGAQSRLEVASSNVALASDSLAEAYEQQQRQLPRDTPEAHLGLAEWCLRYNLLSQAGRELADARRLDVRSSKLDLLKRRLDVATQTATPRKTVDDEAADTNQQSTAESARLEALATQLPAGAMERFTRKVQPLLVNSCTTAGCHQAASKQVFQLDRAVLHGLSNRRTTLSNLAATLALLNRSAPQLSPLLTIPRAEHAGMKQPIMGSRQDQQFRQLEEWVALVTGTQMPDEETLTATKTAGEVGTKRGTTAQRRGKSAANKVALTEPRPFHIDNQPTGGSDAAKRLDDSTDQAESNANSSSAVVQASNDELLPFQQLQQRKRPTAQLKTWQSKDEFDPEIFNRQNSRATSTETNSDRGKPAPDH
jgi:hypothetical protein